MKCNGEKMVDKFRNNVEKLISFKDNFDNWPVFECVGHYFFLNLLQIKKGNKSKKLQLPCKYFKCLKWLS